MNIQSHIEKVNKFVPGQMSAAEQAFVLNVLELVLQQLGEQRQLIQTLKDEINRLKGEQGKPDIKGKNQKEGSPDPAQAGTSLGQGDVSSEKRAEKQKGRAKKTPGKI